MDAPHPAPRGQGWVGSSETCDLGPHPGLPVLAVSACSLLKPPPGLPSGKRAGNACRSRDLSLTVALSKPKVATEIFRFQEHVNFFNRREGRKEGGEEVCNKPVLCVFINMNTLSCLLSSFSNEHQQSGDKYLPIFSLLTLLPSSALS